MNDNTTYDVSNNIRIHTPGNVWATLSLDEIPVDLDFNEPAEAVYRLAQIFRCDVSLEQTHQVTHRWKK